MKICQKVACPEKKIAYLGPQDKLKFRTLDVNRLGLQKYIPDNMNFLT